MAKFKVWANDDVPTHTEINEYWQEQVLIRGTAAERAALASPEAGWHFYETDTGFVYLYHGGAWVQMEAFAGFAAYTPTFAGSALTVGNAATPTGAYMRQGKLIHFRARFILGSTSAIGTGVVTVTLPATGSAGVPLGGFDCRALDSSTGAYYPLGHSTSTTLVTLHEFDTSLNGQFNNLGASSPFTWATSDELLVAGWYEAA